ncbi:MAG: hypothetical protein J0M24_02880 [Verrucomicrobia bacterium]|nr:hypothetical protein [Verrucomicrobiota bacterium]
MDLLEHAQGQRLVHDSLQNELSRRWLDPVLTDLLREVSAARREVDAELRHRFARVRTREGFDMQTYPVGWCRHIRDGVWNRVQGSLLIQSLIRQGLVFRKVFVVQRRQFFQNSIQLGDHFLDVANDAVDAHKPPVVCETLAEAGVEDLDSWPQFAEVAQPYDRVRLLPNRWFPLVFPVMPFLAIRESGLVEGLYQQDQLFLLDVGEHFRRARELLSHSLWLTCPIPDGLDQELVKRFTGPSAQPLPIEFRPSSRADLQMTLKDWEAVTQLPLDRLRATLLTTLRLTGELAQALRRAGIQFKPGS